VVSFLGKIYNIQRVKNLLAKCSDILASLAYNVRLQTSSEDLVNDAITMVWVRSWKRVGLLTVAMHHIKGSNKELMCILLFIAC
jgi:hypothetical protein